MKRYHIVDPKDSKITQTITASDPKMVEMNTPKGHHAIQCDDLSIVAGDYFYNFIKKEFEPEDVLPPAVAEVETKLLTAVDQQREDLQMLMLTPGGAKSMVYAAKQAELQEYNSSGSSEAERYPYATLEATAGNETLADVMARWNEAVSRNMQEVQRIEAIAIVAKRRIKAATSVVEKQTIFDEIDWAWTPEQ